MKPELVEQFVEYIKKDRRRKKAGRPKNPVTEIKEEQDYQRHKQRLLKEQAETAQFVKEVDTF